MSPPDDLLEVTGIASGICEGLGVPYAVGGAVAQNFWGVIRGILWNQKGKLDIGYVREWAGKMLADPAAAELERWILEYAS